MGNGLFRVLLAGIGIALKKGGPQGVHMITVAKFKQNLLVSVLFINLGILTSPAQAGCSVSADDATAVALPCDDETSIGSVSANPEPVPEGLASVQPVALGAVIRRNDRGCPTFRARSTGVCRMSQVQAERYCSSHGTRLPTVREHAIISQGQGACGILSPEDYNIYQGTPTCPRASYYRVRVIPNAQEPAGDEFYYSQLGYRPPHGELGNHESYWSMSVLGGYTWMAYATNGFSGILGSNNRDFHPRDYWRAEHSTRCVQSH